MSSKKRMGGMKLGDFGKNTPTPTETTSEEPQKVLDDKPIEELSSANTGRSPKRKPSKKSKLVTVNIKIEKQQQDWLRETAQTVRDNNDEPVPAPERVYPQHLIGVAVELLQTASIDWDTVKNADELRKALNL